MTEELFYTIIDLSINPRIILIPEEGRIARCNEAFRAGFGFTDADIVSLDERALWVSPKFRINWLSQLRETGSVDSFAAYLFDNAGEIRSVLINAIGFEWQGADAVLVEINDLTEKERITTSVQAGLVKLHNTMESMIRVIAGTVELKDPYTAGHQKRVSVLATEIARRMNFPEDRIEGIRVAGLIHDIGKIAVPVEILSKPGKLSVMEFELIKTHSRVGYDLLKDIEFAWPLADIVHQHHERMDGSGYPRGLAGDAILPEARIISVADVVEAITYHRPYREGLGVGVAIDALREGSGKHFDPQVVSTCIELLEGGLDLLVI